MLHTKFHCNQLSDSGEKDFLRFFTIYGRGSPHGNVAKPIFINFHIRAPKIFHIVFGFK